MKKSSAEAKDIVARSITLKDSNGKARIFMGVMGKPAYSTICLFGERDRAIELSADPEGGLHISLRDGTGKLVAGLGITSNDRVGLSLFDHRSGTMTQLGSELNPAAEDGEHQITLIHRGKVRWTTRKKLRRAKAAPVSVK